MPVPCKKPSLPFSLSIFGLGQSAPAPPATLLTSRVTLRKSATIKVVTKEVVQVWLAGEWKPVAPAESADIIQKKHAGNFNFQIAMRGEAYRIDLTRMTQMNMKSGRTRAIRIVYHDTESAMMGFDQFRTAFQERASSNSLRSHLTEDALLSSRPFSTFEDQELAECTAAAVIKSMSLRDQQHVDMTEWIHYWALERDAPSQAASAEVNERLRKALISDPQLLGRMQMHFETAARPVDGSAGALGLSSKGLLQVCKKLVASVEETTEKAWAKELLQRQASMGSDVLEEDEVLSYHDFLNVMLGRKRFKVYLYMYDITDGAAKRWSWLVLGQEFKGFWHTGLVVEWPGEHSEIWFGGKVFDSPPCKTPFGQPQEKRFLGYTYKHKDDALYHIARHLCPEFTKENYDVMTHNCNHFSDKLSRHLLNEHIPEEVRRQPEMIMQTTTAKVLRPLLNRWLGGFEYKEHQACQNFDDSDNLIMSSLGPMAIVEFAKQEGGRLQLGRVEAVGEESCVITSLDFWRACGVEREVPFQQITQVLEPGLQKAKTIPELDEMLNSSYRKLSCAWLPSVLTPCYELTVQPPVDHASLCTANSRNMFTESSEIATISV